MKNDQNNKNFILKKGIQVHFVNVEDNFVKQWLFQDIFDVDKDYILFTTFMEQKFDVVFDHVNLTGLNSKSNDIMLMEAKEIIEFNNYIASYNKLITIGKGEQMPKLTKQCERLYAEQKVELANQKVELANQKLINIKYETEIENLKLVLKKHGIDPNGK
ncbi:hypothetical protein [Spiroplasma culicicola]|uniref:Uncharacterized protein n=1 Tax=Spiroplasma culicicola AES-1 TaxID=1276246 RepID=W6A6R1_9MOLU|nr:hypothetical protein [Spiroplasma culicicola]AHI52555.1 hypothetical protein SCULI_v1c02140 [Spiroplasma culicicola AES-1]